MSFSVQGESERRQDTLRQRIRPSTLLPKCNAGIPATAQESTACRKPICTECEESLQFKRRDARASSRRPKNVLCQESIAPPSWDCGKLPD